MAAEAMGSGLKLGLSLWLVAGTKTGTVFKVEL